MNENMIHTFFTQINTCLVNLCKFVYDVMLDKVTADS